MKLTNKKILFIGPMTFGYHESIKTKLQEMGAQVDLFAEDTLSIQYRISRIIGSKYLDKYKSNFNKKIIKQAANVKYDYVFLIRGDFLNSTVLQEIKNLQPSAKFITYQWDSLARFNYLPLLNDFDKIISFDSEDCKKHNFNYLPLFFDDSYKKLRESQKQETIDLLFIGTLHSDRLEVLKKVEEQAKNYNLSYKFYLYTPFMTHVKNLILNREYKYDKKFIIFKPITKEHTLKLLEISKAVIDINNLEQSGLTIRTMETLGAGKKLFTTNNFIKNEPFYNQEDIFIIDRRNPMLSREFITNNRSDNMYSDVSIEYWLMNIFQCKKY